MRSEPRAGAGRPLASHLPTRGCDLGAAFGEKSGWERELVRAGRARGRRVASAARLGKEALVARDRLPSTARVARQGRCSTSRRSPSSTSRAGTRRVPRGPLRQPGRARVGRVTYTQMLNPLGGIECDFTVTRLAEDWIPDRHRHGVRPARRCLDPPALPRRVRARRRRHFGVAASASGALRVIRSSSHSLTVLFERRLSVMAVSELAVGPIPCLAVRVTYVSELS